EDRGLPGRAGPVVVVRGALQREGGAVGGQAHAARVVGHAAAEAGRHGGRPEGVAAGRRRHRRRARGRLVQGEAARGAGEGVAVLVGPRCLDRVGAVARRSPGGQGGAAGPGGRRAPRRGVVGGRQVGRGAPGRTGPVEAIGAALQGEGGAVGGQAHAAAVV